MKHTLTLTDAELADLQRAMRLATSHAWADAAFIRRDGGEHRRFAARLDKLASCIDRFDVPREAGQTSKRKPPTPNKDAEHENTRMGVAPAGRL